MVDDYTKLPMTLQSSGFVASEWLLIAAFATTSLVSIRILPSMTLADGLLAAASFFLVLRLLAKGGGGGTAWRPRSPRSVAFPRSVALWTFFIAVGGLTASFRAEDPVESLTIALRLFLVTGVLVFLVWHLLPSERHIGWAVGVLATSGGLQGLAAIGQLGGLDVPWSGYVHYGRFTGLSDHTSDLGVAVAIVIPLCLVSLIALGRTRRGLIYFSIIGLLSLCAVFLSGSLSAIAGAICGLAMTILVLCRAGQATAVLRRTAAAGLFLSVVGALALSPWVGNGLARDPFATVRDPGVRLDEVVNHGGTASTRVEMLKRAASAIGQNPLVGAGFDKESSRIYRGSQTHNMLFLAWHDGGILTLLGILGLIFTSIRTLVGGTKGTRRLVMLRAGLLGSILSMLVSVQFQPFLYKRFIWIPVAVALAPPFLARMRRWSEGQDRFPSVTVASDASHDLRVVGTVRSRGAIQS